MQPFARSPTDPLFSSLFSAAISKRQSVPNLVSLFDRQKSTLSEEDPYSIPGNNSSSSGSRSSGHYASGPIAAPNGKPVNGTIHSEPKPPKLPPRDFERKQKSRLLSSKKTKNGSKESEEENSYAAQASNSRVFGTLFTTVSYYHSLTL